MARSERVRLFHKAYKWVSPVTGRPRRSQTSTWYAAWRENGVRRTQALGTSDRLEAEILAGKIAERLRLRALGLSDPTAQHRALPTWRHALAFLRAVRGRGRSRRHVRETGTYLVEALRAIGARRLDDLDSARLSTYIDSLRRQGRAARTINHRIVSAKGFSRWLVESHRLAFNPFAGLRALGTEADRRRVRRALTRGELARLLRAARRRPAALAVATAAAEAGRRAAGTAPRRTAAEVTAEEKARLRGVGAARARVYRFAAGTGLRRGEIARLRWAHLDLEGDTVTVVAGSAKARREQTVPLRRGLANALRAERRRRAAEPVTAAVFRPRWIPTPRAFLLDLTAAGIPAQGEDGRFVDFHALRTTFVSWVASAGAHPRVAQALARHASVELTMRAYTDLTLLDVRGAVEAAWAAPGAAAGAAQGRAFLPRSSPTGRAKGEREGTSGHGGGGRRPRGDNARKPLYAARYPMNPPIEEVARGEGVEPSTFGSVVRESSTETNRSGQLRSDSEDSGAVLAPEGGATPLSDALRALAAAALSPEDIAAAVERLRRPEAQAPARPRRRARGA